MTTTDPIIGEFGLGDIDNAAGELLRKFPGTRVFAFFGEMGAGKTTFIKAMCRRLGVEQFVTSPTFALINEYTADNGKARIFHFDFYRVESISEVMDLGYEDYFYSDSICFIEWPEKVSGLLPPGALRLSIEITAHEKRSLSKLPE
jgi:tRNA threonylcarbamoyladenosine biosynthesis protein TsaE